MSTSDVFSRDSRATVLFVEDNAELRFIYQSLAIGEGFGVELAANGREAIVLASILLPDVIVVDLELPDINGVEVARRLRASRRTRGIPLVVIGGHETEETNVALRAIGCDGHLVKPCSADDLFRLVGALTIGARHPTSALPADAIGQGAEVPLPPESHARLSSDRQGGLS